MRPFYISRTCHVNFDASELADGHGVVLALQSAMEIKMTSVRSRLDELCAAFNVHDLDKIMDLFANDCVLEMPRGDKPWGTRFEGKAAVREGLASRFEGLPDVHYGESVHFVDEKASTGITKWTLTGTTIDGKRLELWGCDFYTFRDGLAIRKDAYWKIVD
jgi:ketosteroid isomerase-like protein